jgi:hypothetical protein
MESSSNFLDVLVEWLHEMGLPSINQFEAVQLLVAVLLILFFLLWLVLRKTRLWYWKKEEEIDTLKSIDIHLKNMEEKLSADLIRIVDKTDSAPEPQNDETDQPDQELQLEMIPEEDKQTVVGRSGKVYTETELELLIRD